MYNNTKILTELIRYIYDHCIELDNKRNITCRYVEQLHDGTKIIIINNRFFEHLKKLQDWFNTTSNNIIKDHLSITLEKVFGPEFVMDLEITVEK